MAFPAMAIDKLFSLAGKTAVVITGEAGGLALAMTTALASAGADIIAIQPPHDPESAALKASVEACGRRFDRYECDLRDARVICAVYENIWFDGNTADILLHCAGAQQSTDDVGSENDRLELVLDVNIKAAVVSCQESARPLLRANRSGKIINVASFVPVMGSKHIATYAASKGAVLQVTKALSNAWAKKGIQCNCICPG